MPHEYSTRGPLGMNWTEWVVGGMVLLLFVALTIPAIQQARESARRTQSRNNLKQFGLGLENYMSSYSCLPPGGTFDRDGKPYHGWTMAILPYMEASRTYTLVDFNLPWDDPKNFEHFVRTPHCFIDPGVYDYDVKSPDGLRLVTYAANSWVMHRNSNVREKQLDGHRSEIVLVGDARGNFSPFGFPSNWRDITAGLNSSTNEFGHPYREQSQFVLADGSVKTFANDTAKEVLATFAGPESLRPSAAQSARLPLPYRVPPGGYWKREAIAKTPDDYYIELRFDPAGLPRIALENYFEKAPPPQQIPEIPAGEPGPFVRELLKYPTLNEISLPQHVPEAGLMKLRALPELRKLKAGGDSVTDSSFRALAEFPALETLELYYPTVTDQGLMSAHPFSKLRRLVIRHDEKSDISPRGILGFMEAHPHINVRLVWSNHTGDWKNWYTRRWSPEEIELLVKHNVPFDDPLILAERFDFPADSLFPENMNWRMRD